MTAYKSRTWMRKKYVVEKWNQQQIADYCKTDQATISRWLKKHGLK